MPSNPIDQRIAADNVALRAYDRRATQAEPQRPPLPDRAARQRWVEVCTAEYERLRAGEGGVLRGYAGVNPGEFFAVATEVFFDRPIELAADKPALYEVLRDCYHQDPAGRAARART